MRSLADGHCLIHSILSCLRAKYGASELSVNDLLRKLENKCYENVEKYMPYFYGDYISFFQSFAQICGCLIIQHVVLWFRPNNGVRA